jgi:hypothetical protein
MRLLLALSLGALFLSACNAVPPSDRPAGRSTGAPDDFSVRYFWDTGSLPPEYHYRHVIEVQPDGSGTTSIARSYGDGPSQTLPFQLDEGAMDALYADLDAAGLFSTQWRQESDPPVGGSYWSLTAMANGRTVEVPTYVVEGQQATAEQIAGRVRAAVPDTVQAALDAWREGTEQ